MVPRMQQCLGADDFRDELKDLEVVPVQQAVRHLAKQLGVPIRSLHLYKRVREMENDEKKKRQRGQIGFVRV